MGLHRQWLIFHYSLWYWFTILYTVIRNENPSFSFYRRSFSRTLFLIFVMSFGHVLAKHCTIRELSTPWRSRTVHTFGDFSRYRVLINQKPRYSGQKIFWNILYFVFDFLDFGIWNPNQTILKIQPECWVMIEIFPLPSRKQTFLRRTKQREKTGQKSRQPIN